MAKINTGLDKYDTEKIKLLLETLLASEYTLAIKTQKFHWNVEGIHFSQLHEVFGEQYEKLQERIDEIAERIRKIGFYSIGSISEFLNKTKISDNTTQRVPEKDMIKELYEDYETIIRIIREKLEEDFLDHGTEDFLIETMQEHEETAWMLRSHLE